MYIARIIALFTAIPVHESAHAWVSGLLGDPTAKRLGRISLNPAKHFDLGGTICMLLLGFGWAKPVPIDVRYYSNKKAGMALSSFAGPLSNLLMAFILIIFFKIVSYFIILRSATAFLGAVRVILFYMISINILLAVFNMLPVPPLDGSRIFLLFLPERAYFNLMRFERYIMIIVFVLLWTGYLSRPLGLMQNGVFNIMDSATKFVDAVMKIILAPKMTSFV